VNIKNHNKTTFCFANEGTNTSETKKTQGSGGCLVLLVKSEWVRRRAQYVRAAGAAAGGGGRGEWGGVNAPGEAKAPVCM